MRTEVAPVSEIHKTVAAVNDLLLSIVIPIYNEKATLFEILQRVVAVDVGMSRELILVDDGSTDGTRDLYLQCEQKWPGETFHIKLQSTNKGKGEHPAGHKMREVMTASPKQVNAEAKVAEAVRIMQSHRIDELLVVDDEGRLVGMIDIQDLLAKGFTLFDEN